jgi:hypothetical protein
VTGENNSDSVKKEIADLTRIGNELLDLLEDNAVSSEREYQKKRNMFIAEYNKWYARCLPIIRSMIPDGAIRFESLHHTTKRSGTNEYTYTIQDYIHGIYFKDKPKSYTDSIALKRLKEQNIILQNALPRTNDFSFEMEKFVKINPIRSQPSYSISKQEKFVDIDFPDEHYNSIRTEINSSFKRGFTISAYLLSRELIRNLLLDMLRKRFPPTSAENVSLYYDLQNNSHKEIRALSGVIKERKDDFDINPEALDHLIEMIEIMEPKTKPASHSFLTIPTRENIEKYRIEEIAKLLLEMIEFMAK